MRYVSWTCDVKGRFPSIFPLPRVRGKHQRCIRSSAIFYFDLSFLPLNHGLIRPWHQLADAVGRMILDAFQDPSKPSFWIDAVELACLDQGIGYGGGFSLRRMFQFCSLGRGSRPNKLPGVLRRWMWRSTSAGCSGRRHPAAQQARV